jgi:hypothetical protein
LAAAGKLDPRQRRDVSLPTVRLWRSSTPAQSVRQAARSSSGSLVQGGRVADAGQVRVLLPVRQLPAGLLSLGGRALGRLSPQGEVGL